MTNLFSRLASYFAWAGVFLASGAAANNHLFVPGQPCTGCTVEISDHSGVIPTSKNAVYRVQNPVTPNGVPPFLELYSPDMAKLQNCLNMVTAVQGQTPFSVQLKASEYTLANSNQVVFLVDKCRQVQGSGAPNRPMMQGNPSMPVAGAPSMQNRPGNPGMRPGPNNQMTQPGQMMPGNNAQMVQPGNILQGGRIAPGTNCGSGTPPPSTSCAVTGGGWQTVSNVLSEASCNLSYDDSVKPGRQQVIYDNTYSVTCAGGTYQPSVYVGNAPSQSNWGAFVNNSAACQMRTGTLPSGARGVLTIVCP